MKQRVFIRCLNKQRKIYNFNLGALIGCGFGMLVVGIGKGLIWGLGAGAVGLSIVGGIANAIYSGELQRLMYWHLPYAKYWLSPYISESAQREEL